MSNEFKWSNDIELVLQSIRENCVLMSKNHKKQYLYLKYILRYFRLPIILISGLSSVAAVGLQPYIEQQNISVITCMLSLTCGILGSIELFLGVQTQMEAELLSSKDYYLLSIEIYKILSLLPQNRNVDGKAYLEQTYSVYVKLIEKSNILNKKISDKLTPLPSGLLSFASLSVSSAGSEGSV